ncbi:hypothetical protein ACI68E_003604 [Malassezia pachydermatis]
MYMAGHALSLWRTQGQRQAREDPLAWMPDAPCTVYDTAPLSAEALEKSVVVAQRVHRAWQTRGATPRRVIRFRAHVNRITSVKLVVGHVHMVRRTHTMHADYWLVTGSVDGFVRVWDVTRILQERGSMDVTAALEAVQQADSSTEDLPKATNPSADIRKSTRAFLVAEIDTGGDVTHLDAQMDASTNSMMIAVGSYYSSAGCLLYALDLTAMPRMLDLRASLDPPEWSGTQCVSLLDHAVAIGTYTGRVYLLHWDTGERHVLEHAERGSVAALKLLGTHLLAVSRLGHVSVFKRTPDGCATLVAEYDITQRPLLSAAFGEVDAQRAGTMMHPARPASLTLMCVDPIGLTHLEWPTGTWTSPPECLGDIDMHGERLIGASVGASGTRAILASSLGGVPPMCAVRSYRRGGPPLCALRPTPDIALPPLAPTSTSIPWQRPTSPSLSPSPSSTALDAQAAAPPPRTGRVRVDSFSSDSTSTTSSTAPALSSRIDMLTESAIDEARGLVCLASVRGAIWIADYGGSM